MIESPLPGADTGEVSRRPSRRARAAAVTALLGLGVSGGLAGCTADGATPTAASPVAAASPLAAPTATRSGRGTKKAAAAARAARTPKVLTRSTAAGTGEPAAMALPGPPVRPVPPVGTRRPPTLPPTEDRYRRDCAPLYQPGTTVALEATTRNGRLVVSWPHNADPATIRYRVGVQPLQWVAGTGDTRLTRPAITWADVAAPTGCRAVSYTVPTARRGVGYRVWLEVDVRSTVGDPTRMSIGRLTGVTLG